MKNMEIRKKASEKGVKLWEIAYRFGVTDGTLCRWMRVELPEQKKESALRFIDEIAKEKEE